MRACAQGCGHMTEDKVRLVLGGDGRPTGEAYVEISGPGARLRLALAKDRQVRQNRAPLFLEDGWREGVHRHAE